MRSQGAFRVITSRHNAVRGLCFCIPPLTAEMSLFEDLYLDSTTMLETLMELEGMLGFRVDPNSLEVEDFLTVESFVTFLETVTQQPK